MPSLTRLLALASLTAASVLGLRAHAQAEVDGPTALIYSYRAHPGMRTPFRAEMHGEGIQQLETWKREGVIANYQALFTTYAANVTPDLFVVLRFHHFTDLARWQRIEREHPGGLPLKAQAMADVDTSGLADIVQERNTPVDEKEAQYFILQYDVLVDTPKYVSYVKGYVAPQFEKWADAGILSGYSSFVNQNPAGAPWTSFMVLEYKDLKSLAAREVVKTQARIDLGNTNATWKKWSDDKTAIRKEKMAIPAINLAAQ